MVVLHTAVAQIRFIENARRGEAERVRCAGTALATAGDWAGARAQYEQVRIGPFGVLNLQLKLSTRIGATH
jgi:hypothetical protein